MLSGMESERNNGMKDIVLYVLVTCGAVFLITLVWETVEYIKSRKEDKTRKIKREDVEDDR